MEENPVTRDDIHLISRNSNWSAESIRDTFYRTGIYAGKKTWQQFLILFLFGLGLAFAVAGIIFFFAFNWAQLHKFAKLGMIAGLIAGCIALSLWHKRMEPRLKNIFLTAAAVLIGALFAVFGQVYQTGADAYDLFLGWTLAIVVWTLVSGFPVLWFVFIALCNTTLCLYAAQIARDWQPSVLYNLLFVMNAIFVILMETAAIKDWIQGNIKWFSGLAATVAVICITLSICYGILDESTSLFISLPLALAGLGLGIWYGFRSRNLLYLAIIPFGIMIMLITLILKPFKDPIGIFFVISVLIIAFTTILIMQLVKLNKRWHEKEDN